jgi:nucleotide-binding universal stress UspA family protein
MIKLLAYTDGKAASETALHFAAELKKRLAADLTVITVRPGTHATEEPPPVGVEFPLAEQKTLPAGLQILTRAVGTLARDALFDVPKSIVIRDMPHGHLFVVKSPSGDRIPFYECFGHFIETLNLEVDQNKHNLLVISPPKRSGLQRLVVGDTTRKLALDLHTSVLVVRGGGPDSPFMICADGSASSRRQFPLLKALLPAVIRPIELLYAKKSDSDPEGIQAAEDCLAHAVDWLETCDKNGPVHRLEGDDPAELIVEAAGDDSVIVMGASLRHDVYRRMLGSLPMQVLSRTASSVLLVKLPPEADSDFFKDPFTC